MVTPLPPPRIAIVSPDRLGPISVKAVAISAIDALGGCPSNGITMTGTGYTRPFEAAALRKAGLK